MIRASDPDYESTHLIRAAGEEPKVLTFEPLFTGYVRNWARFPTLDMTSQALHCLLAVDETDVFASRYAQPVMGFLEECWGGGFAISPLFRGRPTLYATLNGIGVIKALLGIPQNHRLRMDRVAQHLGPSWAQRLAGLRSTLHEFVRGGEFVDDPETGQASVQALHCAASLLWNLEASAALFGEYVRQEEVAAFLRACRADSKEGFGFRGSPDSDHEGPCSTTTGVVIQLQEHFDIRAFRPEERSGLWSFLRETFVEGEGGFRVFPNQPPTLSATQAALRAIDSLAPARDLLSGSEEWIRHLRVQVPSFVGGCARNDGGYAFHPSKVFSSNIFATRCALRVDAQLRGEPQPSVIDRKALVSFIAEAFDEFQGAFWGYGAPAAQAALKRFERVRNVVAERGSLTATDVSAICLIDPFDAAYALEALFARKKLVRRSAPTPDGLGAMYSLAA